MAGHSPDGIGYAACSSKAAQRASSAVTSAGVRSGSRSCRRADAGSLKGVPDRGDPRELRRGQWLPGEAPQHGAELVVLVQAHAVVEPAEPVALADEVASPCGRSC